MFRKLAVLLAVMIPLAADVTEPAGTVRIDVVVTGTSGDRVRGLDVPDFEVTENGEKRTVVKVEEFAPEATAAPPVTDTTYVPLVAPASPTPPRRLMFLYDDQTDPVAARKFLDNHLRGGDQVMVAPEAPGADLPSRVAAAVIELAKFPEKKALLVMAQTNEKAAAFAWRRGVALYDINELDAAAAELASYYSIVVRAANPGAVRIRTTRPLTVRSTALYAPLGTDDAISDAVLAQHVGTTPANELGIRLAADTAVADGAKRRVKLHVLIPIRNLALQAQGEKVTGGFDVFFSFGDANGSFSPVTKQTHVIDWPAAALAQAGDRNMDYTVDLVIEGDRSRVSVGVVDHRSKKTGYQRIEVPG